MHVTGGAPRRDAGVQDGGRIRHCLGTCYYTYIYISNAFLVWLRRQPLLVLRIYDFGADNTAPVLDLYVVGSTGVRFGKHSILLILYLSLSSSRADSVSSGDDESEPPLGHLESHRGAALQLGTQQGGC